MLDALFPVTTDCERAEAIEAIKKSATEGSRRCPTCGEGSVSTGEEVLWTGDDEQIQVTEAVQLVRTAKWLWWHRNLFSNWALVMGENEDDEVLKILAYISHPPERLDLALRRKRAEAELAEINAAEDASSGSK